MAEQRFCLVPSSLHRLWSPSTEEIAEEEREGQRSERTLEVGKEERKKKEKEGGRGRIAQMVFVFLVFSFSSSSPASFFFPYFGREDFFFFRLKKQQHLQMDRAKEG